MEFQYIEDRGLEEERIYRPMIPVIFKSGSKSMKAYCLIDSGSDYVVLPIEAAGKLSMKLSANSKFAMQGAGGNIFDIYKSPEKIEIIIERKGFKSITLSTSIYFAESGPTILLGQKGFLEYLDVCLHGRSCKVEKNVSQKLK